ncbi:MAG TPA: TIM barrel protein [Spirochaetales bacterium]|nr:TIM barrel protein [Spirochaetales bacterium]
MIKPVICFEMLYPALPPEEKIKKIADAGFEYVEFWSWRDKDIKSIQSVCQEYGIRVANFSGQRAGDLVNRHTHGILIKDLKESLKTAKIMGTHILMILTNELGEGGQVLNSYPNLSEEEKKAAVIDGLKKVSEVIPDEVHIVLEPLNTVTDHRGYYLHNLSLASEILHTVGNSHIKILCDFYHQGMMGDDPEELIKNFINDIGYIHIADYPGRHEPGTGRGDWKRVLSQLKQSNYDGYIGFEYEPLRDSDESLKAIKELWEGEFYHKNSGDRQRKVTKLPGSPLQM